jgi:hypothetical protein
MDECPNCKGRPLTPSQRQEARRKAAARERLHEIKRRVQEQVENSPGHKAFKEWVKAATTIRPEDLTRIVR